MAKGNMSFTFSEREYAQLQNIMTDISNVEQRRIIINSLKKSTRNIVAGGKRNLASRNKRKSGNLSNAFKTSSSKKKVVAYAGFKRGKKGGNHAHLIDRGTVKRWTKKGKYTGSVSKNQPKKGTMFWTDSVMSQGPKAMENLKNTIYNELAKITSRR